jgi:hypothetical protein
MLVLRRQAPYSSGGCLQSASEQLQICSDPVQIRSASGRGGHLRDTQWDKLPTILQGSLTSALGTVGTAVGRSATSNGCTWPPTDVKHT